MTSNRLTDVADWYKTRAERIKLMDRTGSLSTLDVAAVLVFLALGCVVVCALITGAVFGVVALLTVSSPWVPACAAGVLVLASLWHLYRISGEDQT